MLVQRAYRLSVALLMIVATLAITPSTIKAIQDPNGQDQDPGVITIDKTRGDGDEGVYEITLSVVGNPEVMPSDVVLVMDTSNSMDSSKMSAAKNAAVGFVNHLTGLDQGHRIAVVSFATSPSNVHGLSEDAGSINAAINGLGVNGGTHLEGGIKVARDIGLVK